MSDTFTPLAGATGAVVPLAVVVWTNGFGCKPAIVTLVSPAAVSLTLSKPAALGVVLPGKVSSTGWLVAPSTTLVMLSGSGPGLVTVTVYVTVEPTVPAETFGDSVI